MSHADASGRIQGNQRPVLTLFRDRGKNLPTLRLPQKFIKKRSDRWIGSRRWLALLIVVCPAVAYVASATVFASARPHPPRRPLPATLSFEERVNFQRKIEEVYWRHRIWPEEHAGAKPSLDQALPRPQLEKKVADYLQNSRVLEYQWQRSITTEQLQAEINRMATHTKQPAVLRELFEALGNDPRVIAECLARPQVAERELRSRYAFDQRIHGQLRQSAAGDLLAHPRAEQMKLTTGIYSEMELVKSEERSADWTDHSIRLESSDWDETVTKLAAAFDNVPALRGDPDNTTPEKYETIPIGELSPLQEDETRFYAAAVTQAAAGRLKVATVTWSKEPVDSWRAKLATQLPDTTAASIAAYTLPAISGQNGACTADTWASSSLNTPSQRVTHSAIWTGSEVIVWGGSNGGSPPTPTNTGGRYNPSTDTWTTMTTVAAPSARGGHTAVWTGSEMIIWGGGWVNSGARYNPMTDSWVATSIADAPPGRSGHSGVWTGNEMIVWGGRDSAGEFNTGGRYNPNTNSWTPTSTTNAPAARNYHSTVWSGKEMIVWGGSAWGGSAGYQYLNSGGRYNPATNSWVATSAAAAPSARHLHTAVWTGSRMIVWGGINFSDSPYQGYNTGGQYDPETNIWTGTDTAGAPAGRHYHTAIWSGNRMIIWGGTAGGITNSGGRYDPGTNTWAATSVANAPAERWIHAAVWTGSEMVIWGGERNARALNTGGRYDPNTDTWAGPQPLSVRSLHTAVWTGSEMIVWGGSDGHLDLNTGGKYNPATDTFVPTSMVSAPSGRIYHKAIWSGSEMIVWGGFGNTGALNTGGRYHPATDNWAATSIINAPAGRSFHTAIWTGAQMVVWGGHSSGGNMFNTGGKYDPNTDEWTATSTTNAATARSRHTAVWTGSEMVVWAGTPDIQRSEYINTGGRYHPGTDSWKSMSMADAPSPRSVHTAVWTGSEMIVWGGTETGVFSSPYLRSGGRYDPIADNWTATSEIDAPVARGGHTAVWTGDDMIVWGGGSQGPPFWLNSGGRYDPEKDAWTPTATTDNAPIGHAGHTAVWTGSEMIVWGGTSEWGYMNNGGRYCGEPAPPPPPVLLGNISTRMQVGTGNNVLIAGFIVEGAVSKTLLIRAAGPSLSSSNIPSPLPNPRLELHDSTHTIGINDNWQTTQIGGVIQSSQANAIMSSNLVPSDPHEPAMMVTLPPGSYTAVVTGVNDGVGVGTVEVYDVSSGSGARLVNISTRGRVATDDTVLITGLIVVNQPTRLLIRAVGPSLAATGLSNVLANPQLELHDTTHVIGMNDDWQSTQVGGLITADQTSDISASTLAPSDPKEAAMVVTLSPGSYTAIVRGLDRTEGVGTVEVYSLQ